jgi:hypothetical protein
MLSALNATVPSTCTSDPLRESPALRARAEAYGSELATSYQELTHPKGL